MADGICYYDWWFNDWLGSGTRAEMELHDRAIYRDLLDHQAAKGSIPDDINAIANLAMCSPGQAKQFMERWADQLFPVGGDDKRRRNLRMQCVREAIIDRLGKRSAAGQAGAKARWQTHGNRNADAMPRASGSGSKSVLTPEKQNGRIPRARDPDPFDRFWAVVHHRVGKGAARKAFVAALKRPGVTAERLIERMEAFAKTPDANPTDRTPIHPTTWLNQERYDDDEATWNRRTGQERGLSRVRAEPGKYDNVARRVGDAKAVDNARAP